MIHINNPTVDWINADSYVYLNPLIVAPEFNFEKDLNILSRPSHLWVATSGTTSKNGLQLVGLSKSAFLRAAQSVNDHIQVTKKDIWLSVLPYFHVGALSVGARAYLSGIEVISPQPFKWSPMHFINNILEHGATLTSLVPTQVYDLVKSEIVAPPSLRIVFVGGGNLDLSVYQAAKDLGWPLLRTYGMTECGSQVATEHPNRPGSLQILPHIHAKTDASGRLMLQSEALFTGILNWDGESWTYSDPKIDGWYLTPDLCEVKDNSIQPLGRYNSVYKISGELVNIDLLQQKFNEVLAKNNPEGIGKCVICAHPSNRLGHQVDLVVENLSINSLTSTLAQYNNSVLPFERVRNTYSVTELPQTSLAKIKKPALTELLHFTS